MNIKSRNIFITVSHYERKMLENVVKASLIRGRVEKAGLVLSLLEND
jgi:hypothetical protein